MKRSKFWNDQTEAKLRQLVSEKKSCGQIAKILHQSNGTIVGKAKRMGLIFKYKTTMKETQGCKMQKKAVLRSFGDSRPAPEDRVKPRALVDILPLANSNPVHLEQLSSNQCSFPFGTATPYLFCGNIKEDKKKSYCDQHHGVCHMVGSTEYHQEFHFLDFK